MRKAAIVKIILYSITAILLCGILTMGIADKHSFFSDSWFSSDDDEALSVTADDTIDIPSAVNSLKIDWISGDIIITSGKTDTIRVAETSDYEITDSNRMTYAVTGNTVKLNFCKSTKSLKKLNNIKSKTLTVTLPEKLYNKIDIEAVSADVQIDNVRAADIEIETVSGEANLNTVTVDKLDFASVSGDIYFNGDINKDGNFNNVSGNVALILPLTAEWEADFSTMSGKFSTDFAVKTISKSHYTVGNGNITLEFNSVSGDAKVNCKDR